MVRVRGGVSLLVMVISMKNDVFWLRALLFAKVTECFRPHKKHSNFRKFTIFHFIKINRCDRRGEKRGRRV